jgi:hypothetical protein
MIITVRCYLIPADITFDTDDVTVEISDGDDYVAVIFNEESEDPIAVSIDKQHYLAEIRKNDVL